ncbi:phosphoadenylyl-sulfate reductase [Shouchella clausii]|jgi:phosphoadenosine phosphosulfate reductase|uniref:Adenosine 5'-phosphosulfate reductase n=1 Tax=Shouchella clausii TaxID=79880 RepID=A0A268S2R3_SHOCL|nr:phosphoadenosine phosphosulfate reductase [Shouchella clausii]PAD09795.1 phosphoadenosine phosphosulfate reductase [Shouchella clausii]PAD12600.1 phosphoadenosine phosphosulfate reductase [Shouchella clausii]PAE84693.1 phosphoadenosine phosphosulfate reductase [Shouchella clausii]PAF05993.1 phosphoadenosine phosphosulfate reductase [Shouchella clausii]
MAYVYQQMEAPDYEKVNTKLKNRDSLDILRWANQTYGEKLVYACSFGAEAMVLLDLLSKVQKEAHILFLDTDFHFAETYELIERVKERYPKFRINMAKPALSPEEQAERYGEELWLKNPDQCCQIRKLDVLARELEPYDAWLSGLRREQSPTRANTEFVNQDKRFKKVKVCPLIHWTEEEIWMYIKLHQLPYNELHDHHYPSIGCTYCTKAVMPGEDARSGRWAGTGKTECGLHAPTKGDS